MKTLRSRIRLLVTTSLLAICALAALALLVSQRTARAVETGMQAKDAVADVLPPPLYLVELRLVVGMAANGLIDAAHAKTERDRLVKEFRERAAYWAKSDDAPRSMVEAFGVGRSSAEHLIAAGDAVLDAAAQGDAARTRELLVAAHEAYVAHRKDVEVSVEQATIVATEAERERAMWTAALIKAIAAIGVPALLVVLVVAERVRREIYRSTGGEPVQIVEMAAAMAAGDLSSGRDARALEHAHGASALAAVAQMRSTLAGIVGAVREGATGLHDDVIKINSLTGAIEDQARLQAGSVQAGMSAVVQFSEKLAHTTEAVAAVARISAATGERASRGTALMGEVTTSMDEIVAASRRVVSVSAKIDDLARQTGCLAINASVEAARAGEAGRGLACVAESVQRLAADSARAAQEIKAIVAETDRKLTAGSASARSAAQAIREMAEQVQEVGDRARVIDAAAREQLQGVHAIRDAVSGIDQAVAANIDLTHRTHGVGEAIGQRTTDLVRLVAVFRGAAADEQPAAALAG